MKRPNAHAHLMYLIYFLFTLRNMFLFKVFVLPLIHLNKYLACPFTKRHCPVGLLNKLIYQTLSTYARVMTYNSQQMWLFLTLILLLNPGRFICVITNIKANVIYCRYIIQVSLQLHTSQWSFCPRLFLWELPDWIRCIGNCSYRAYIRNYDTLQGYFRLVVLVMFGTVD